MNTEFSTSQELQTALQTCLLSLPADQRYKIGSALYLYGMVTELPPALEAKVVDESGKYWLGFEIRNIWSEAKVTIAGREFTWNRDTDQWFKASFADLTDSNSTEDVVSVYVSIPAEKMSEELAHIVEQAAYFKAFAMKFAAEKAGLARSDRMVVYFRTIQEAGLFAKMMYADYAERGINGTRVPFTYPLYGNPKSPLSINSSKRGSTTRERIARFIGDIYERDIDFIFDQLADPKEDDAWHLEFPIDRQTWLPTYLVSDLMEVLGDELPLPAKLASAEVSDTFSAQDSRQKGISNTDTLLIAGAAGLVGVGGMLATVAVKAGAMGAAMVVGGTTAGILAIGIAGIFVLRKWKKREEDDLLFFRNYPYSIEETRQDVKENLNLYLQRIPQINNFRNIQEIEKYPIGIYRLTQQPSVHLLREILDYKNEQAEIALFCIQGKWIIILSDNFSIQLPGWLNSISRDKIFDFNLHSHPGEIINSFVPSFEDTGSLLFTFNRINYISTRKGLLEFKVPEEVSDNEEINYAFTVRRKFNDWILKTLRLSEEEYNKIGGWELQRRFFEKFFILRLISWDNENEIEKIISQRAPKLVAVG